MGDNTTQIAAFMWMNYYIIFGPPVSTHFAISFTYDELVIANG